MRNSQSSIRDDSTPDAQETQVLVDDIVRYLSGLARLHSEEKTGNPKLSRGLRHLVRALRPYANSPTSELVAILSQKVGRSRPKTTSRKPQAVLPTDLESLGQQEIEEILEDRRYTKQQLAELGFRRFGISRSSLTHIRKEDAVNSVRAALRNERTLDVISEMAQRAGRARTN